MHRRAQIAQVCESANAEKRNVDLSVLRKEPQFSMYQPTTFLGYPNKLKAEQLFTKSHNIGTLEYSVKLVGNQFKINKVLFKNWLVNFWSFMLQKVVNADGNSKYNLEFYKFMDNRSINGYAEECMP